MTTSTEGSARRGTGIAVLFVGIGLACQEVGASLAVLLFDDVGPLGMVMLRLVFSALLLLLIARPRLRGHSRGAWRAVVLFGLVLALMNGFFYLALERLPLGVTVTIEVLGPLTLSIVASRRASSLVWAGLALAGVAALGGGGWDRLDPLGVVFALAAAASWAFYILASARVGSQFPRLDGLAVAMTIGAIVALPFGIADAGGALLRVDLLALGAAVAVLSSTIPYALELMALRRMNPAVFSILMSLGPATASTAGFFLLGQHLTWLELFGIALVIVASMGAVWTSTRRSRAAVGRDGEPDEPFAEPVG